MENMFRLIQSDPRINQQGALLSGLAAVVFIGDALFYTQQGAFRGCGRQTVSAALVVIGMWVIVVPLAVYFTVFTGLRTKGLIVALGAGIGAMAPIQALVLGCCTDYAECAKEALARTRVAAENVDPVVELEDP
jgi:Na+-driven multidrug efflux pump